MDDSIEEKKYTTHASNTHEILMHCKIRILVELKLNC